MVWSLLKTDNSCLCLYGRGVTGQILYGGELRFLNKNRAPVASLNYMYVGNVQNGMTTVRIGSDEMAFCDMRNAYYPMNADWFGNLWGYWFA